MLLASALVCAACGIVYELALVALGAALVGSSVTQTALVVSVTLSAMGLGALAAKPLARRPVVAFAAVEATLGLVGGLSVLLLYAAFAWLDLYTPLLLGFSVAVGALIGAEIPLLMRMVQQVREQEASAAVADLSAADYLGALVGGLAFPFVLLPAFGLLRGTVLVGVTNVLGGWVVAGWLFGRGLAPRERRSTTVLMAAAAAVLMAVAVLAPSFEITARQALYDDPIVHVERSIYAEIVLTARSVRDHGTDVRLFLNGDLQLSSVDEHRYHEALVHPALAGPRQRVLVLGGGDGMALREVLRYPDVRAVTLVDLDAAVTRLAATDPRLVELNRAAFADPRVELVHADAFAWLRQAEEAFDVVIADLPDPDVIETAKLYSVELYGLAARVLRPGGRLVVQAGSPYFAPQAFWSVEASVAAAGLATVPYHVDVPSFGDWGFVLAAEEPPRLGLAGDAPARRFLTGEVLQAAAVFPPDVVVEDVRPSTLLDPVILEYAEAGWRHY